MLSFFTNLLSRLFSAPSYSHDLEYYVLSKRPSSVVEMEHWVKEYDRKNNQGWIL
jgi:hypothetical protein